MTKKVIKFISYMLIIALLLQIVSFMPVSALSDVDKATTDAIEDSIALTANAGNWTKARADGCAWNFFHNAVQREIWRVYESQGIGQTELPIANKYENGVPTGKPGRADLFWIVGEDTYIWEVKPASFLEEPKKTKGEKQLQGYVDSKSNYINGNYRIESNMGEGFIVSAPSGAKYRITYYNAQNGLILYWFDRIEKEEEEPSARWVTPVVKVMEAAII